MNIEDKLAHFMDVSKQTASEKHDKIIAQYKTQLDNIFEDHKTEALRKAALSEKIATDSLQRSFRKDLSHEQVTIKQNLSLKMNHLKNELFTEVLTLLAEFKQSPAYIQLLTDQILQAKAAAKDADDMTIYIDPEDSVYQKQLEEAANVPLTISSYSFMGGTRAVIPSKNILIDESFQSKIDEKRDHFNFNIKL